MSKQGFYPVTDITDADWLVALGDRSVAHDHPTHIGRSELGVCCAVISSIRDLLYQCQEQGGLFQADVRSLRQLCRTHERGTWSAEPVLSRVAAALGLFSGAER